MKVTLPKTEILQRIRTLIKSQGEKGIYITSWAKGYYNDKEDIKTLYPLLGKEWKDKEFRKQVFMCLSILRKLGEITPVEKDGKIRKGHVKFNI